MVRDNSGWREQGSQSTAAGVVYSTMEHTRKVDLMGSFVAQPRTKLLRAL